MAIDIGSEIDGQVTGITNYGAFISLPEGATGLVHISQIADNYVKDIKEHLKLGDVVKVRVMKNVQPGKYDLSIKLVGKSADAMPAPGARAARPSSRPSRPPGPSKFSRPPRYGRSSKRDSGAPPGLLKTK